MPDVCVNKSAIVISRFAATVGASTEGEVRENPKGVAVTFRRENCGMNFETGSVTLSFPASSIIITATAVTFANHYPGTASQTYDGFDLNVNARPTRRFFLLAGLSIGRTITKNCAVVDNPQTLLFCESDQPFQGTYRVSGGYTFPRNIQVSSVFQSIPPASFQPTYTVTSTAPGITLGRPIVAGQLSAVPVVAPYTFFLDRVNQVDLRVTKAFQIEQYRIEFMADLYNALNASPVTGRNAAIGAGFYTPTSILQSGFLKVGARFTF